MHIPHKVKHEVRNYSQLSYLPRVDVLFEKCDLVLVECASFTLLRYQPEEWWVPPGVKVPVWAQVEYGAEEFIA